MSITGTGAPAALDQAPDRRLTFNGRFLAARQTGVQRVAAQLLAQLDRLAEGGRAAQMWTIAAPKTAPNPSVSHISLVRSRSLAGHLWEQLELPRAAAGSLLVNLCNTAPLFGGPMVTMFHDAQVFTTPESYSPAFVAWYRFAMPRAAARSELVLTVSEFSRGELAKAGVAPVEKIRVIRNGADHLCHVEPDPDAVAALQLASAPYVVALSSTQRHKNIQVLFRAFADPALSGVRLVLIGSAQAADFKAAGLDPPPNVCFAGPVGDGAMRAIVEGALCFACPSLTEGFGLPPMEAMSLGVPAVVAPCGALPEVCGPAALYAEPHAPGDWTGAIRSLADDADQRKKLTQRARTHAAQFTWRASAEALLDALAEAG